VGAILLRVRRQRSARAWPWRLFLIGVGGWVAGDFVWLLHDSLGLSAIPARLEDGCYLAAYLPLAAALVGFAASRRDALDSQVRQLLDVGVLFFSGFTALWFFALAPVVARTAWSVDGVLSVAYPVLDLFLLTLLLRLVVSGGGWSMSFRFLTFAFASTFTGDIVWREMLAYGVYSVGSWINVFFLAGYAMWGIAALHPSGSSLLSRATSASAPAARRRIWLLATAVLPPAAVVVLRPDRLDGATDIAVMLTAVAVVPLLGLARINSLVRSLVESERNERGAHEALGAVIQASPVPICVLDPGRVIRLWNRAAEAVSGYPAAEVIGSSFPIQQTADTSRVEELCAQTIAGAEHRGARIQLADRLGYTHEMRLSTAPLPGVGGGMVALLEDVTEEARRAAEIAFLAGHDPLTGLPNRRTFETQLQEATDAGVAGSATCDRPARPGQLQARQRHGRAHDRRPDADRGRAHPSTDRARARRPRPPLRR
jgi:PAS domain S-box-containing protein